MLVTKRDGSPEPVNLGKVIKRIVDLSGDLPSVDPCLVATKVVQSLRDRIPTSKLEGSCCEVCAVMTAEHPEYGLLAGRFARSDLEKANPRTFSHTMILCGSQLHPTFLQHLSQFGCEMDVMVAGATFDCSYHAFVFLERWYLLRFDGRVVETPERMFARVAFAIHAPDMAAVAKAFSRMVCGHYIQASPTLFNAGTKCSQLCGSFLLSVRDDAIPGIFATLADCAQISKASGGIGLDFTMVRARGTASTDGVCTGIVPALRVFNAFSLWVDQGGPRSGAWAAYLEPWHSDVLAFLELRLNQGHEEARSREQLSCALRIPDLFYHRVEADLHFTLFCPTVAVNSDGVSIHELYGAEFDKAYIVLEATGLGRKVKAREIWAAILKSCVETGACYVVNKDAVNHRNPQKNLGTIKCSSLCAEVLLFTSAQETAVCNLATLALPRFLKAGAGHALEECATPAEGHEAFDYDALSQAAGELVENLDNIIGRTIYPTSELEVSNLKNRPIGVGAQGLGDLFHILMIPMTSNIARAMNKRIFEAIYYGAVKKSAELAKQMGTYESYIGCPDGALQFDMFEKTMGKHVDLFFDWEPLKADIRTHGLRNSTLVSAPVTVCTATILENSATVECSPNMILHKSASGECAILNKYLVRTLERLGKWSPSVRDGIISHGGSVAHLEDLPLRVRQVFQTVAEAPQSALIEMHAERCPFVDQCLSFNINVSDPAMLTSALLKSWKLGLKGAYYTRTSQQVVHQTFRPSMKQADV